MGFFSDLKEDLNQAASEVVGGILPEAGAGEQPVQEESTPSQMANLEEMLQNIGELKITEESEDVQETESTEDSLGMDALQDAAVMADVQEIMEQVEKEAAEEAGLEVEEDSSFTRSMEDLQTAMESIQGSLESMMDQTAAEEPADVNLEAQLRETFGAREGEETAEAFVQAEAIRTGAEVIDKSWVLDLKDMEAADETAIITAGMRVKGDMLSNGSVDVIGEVIGNVQVTGKLNVTGKITGNSKAAEVFADAAKVNGDIISDGTVKIGAGSVVIGNVEATSAAIAGAVKGTIDVKGPVVLDATAVVLGNIRAKSMQINNGARIEGMCVLCYAEQSAAKFFENQDNL